MKAKGVHPNLTPLFNVKAGFDRKHLDKSKGVTVTIDNVTNQLLVINSIEESRGAAWAHLRDRMEKTGWMELHIDTPKSGFFSNDMKMYGAGVAEGLLTAERMSQFYTNFYPLLQPDDDSSRAMMNIRNLYNKELDHIIRKTNLQHGTRGGEPSDPYWKHMRYLLIQLWGLKDAYNVVAQEKGVRTLDMVDMFFINSHAELPEMIQAYSPQAVEDRKAFQAPLLDRKAKSFLQQSSRERNLFAADAASGSSSNSTRPTASEEELKAADRDWKLRLAKHGHCSAMVRLSSGNQDLYVGHTTWSDYSKMLRVYKYYRFHLPLSLQSHTLIGFSSYPGCVSSTDDFYMMDNGLAVMDTSMEILNSNLYSRIPEFPKNPRVPKFLRVMAVNRVAKSGAHWTSMYSQENLGTGNSQWLVVDYNRFTPGEPLGDNAVRILEQVPGLSQQADVTSEVSARGYWGSYNRPFFKDTRRASGHEEAEGKFGSFYSFEGAPRGLIMKKVGSSVSSLADMRAAMTRNDASDSFPGLAGGGPGHAIAARLDLDSSVSNIPNGGIDAKVTSSCLMRKMQCQAISGPSHQTLGAFRWTSKAELGKPSEELFQGWPHMGLPDVYDFDYVQMSADQDKEASSDLTDPTSC
eukprot:TRINITY_DN11246_c1_g2_i1.p1 TRINITY_DN11246_c1_g2~~TRINITY_DN11246_c1_g2_i1.p1  ORF type:complete len:677 (-),score=114.48 TRINITY_DN11246_c1_g2_i1:139-2037(-)